jgi:hypothetical protein
MTSLLLAVALAPEVLPYAALKFPAPMRFWMAVTVAPRKAVEPVM